MHPPALACVVHAAAKNKTRRSNTVIFEVPYTTSYTNRQGALFHKYALDLLPQHREYAN